MELENALIPEEILIQNGRLYREKRRFCETKRPHLKKRNSDENLIVDELDDKTNFMSMSPLMQSQARLNKYVILANKNSK